MQQYFVKRLIRAVIVIWLVASTFFFAMRMISDPVELLFSQSGMTTPQEKQAMREFSKLDSPIHVQYADFLISAVQGDMGYSFRFRQPALPMLVGRIPATLELTFAALAIAAVVGSILGIVAALKPHTLIDHFTIFLSLLGQSVPVFWLGIVLMLVFSVQLGWLPATGREGLSQDYRFGHPGTDSIAEPRLRCNVFALLSRSILLSSPVRLQIGSGQGVPATPAATLPTPLRPCLSATPRSGCPALAALPSGHRQRPGPAQHVTEQPPVQMSLGQQQPVVAGMFDQTAAGLH